MHLKRIPLVTKEPKANSHLRLDVSLSLDSLEKLLDPSLLLVQVAGSNAIDLAGGLKFFSSAWISR